MGYLTILIALGVVLLFGYASRHQRLKTQTKQTKKTSAQVYPLSKAKKQSNLRRVK